MAAYTLRELADYLGCEFQGIPEYSVTTIATLERAGPENLSFVAQPKFVKYLADSKAGILALKVDVADKFNGNKLLVEDPYLAYAKLSAKFESRRPVGGVHPSAVIAASAQVPETVRIGANSVIGEGVVIGDNTEIGHGCVIGDNTQVGSRCVLHTNVNLYHDIVVGDDVMIHSGAVIGADGFGFAPSKEGWIKIHQLGSVRIGNGVEIGANTCIDRGALTDTEIADGVIIDNLVHIAHGVKVGTATAIAACVGIAGSTTIGKNCTIAGAVGISGHLTIGDNSHFHGGTVVVRNVDGGAYASAAPLQDVKKWRRNSVRYTQLDDMAARLRALEKDSDPEK